MMSAAEKLDLVDMSTILSAGERLYRGLQTMQCSCQRQYLYHGAIVRECRRCAAIREWDDITATAIAPDVRS